MLLRFSRIGLRWRCPWNPYTLTASATARQRMVTYTSNRGWGKSGLCLTAGISPCVQRRRIETANAGINQRIGEIRRIQDGIIVPKQNRRPESISDPGRRSSITAGQATRDYRCAAALPCIMPMPRSPAPSPSSRVRCPDRCRRADRRAALPTSRPRPPRSSCRPRWWPSAPCRGTCRRP